MKLTINHEWPTTEEEALKIQKELANEVIQRDQLGEVQLVAGVDVAYSKKDGELVAAVVILDVISYEVIETVTVESTIEFPYIPGLFSFRELPPLISALQKLKSQPDLIVCDGHGYAHPRRFGLACHLGVLFDIPSIGCGKSHMLGEYQEPNRHRGSISYIKDNREIIGAALRSQTDVNSIYVSIGHKISLKTACTWILELTPRYRLPETTRRADQVVKRKLKEI